MTRLLLRLSCDCCCGGKSEKDGKKRLRRRLGVVELKSR